MNVANRIRPYSLVLLSCFWGWGCTSARVAQTTGGDAPVARISEVAVAVRPGALDADTEADYRANAMSGTIRTALVTELRRTGKFASGGGTMDFSVTDFRLRSGAAVFWVGGMSGMDRLAGVVIVRQGGKILKSFEVSAQGRDTGYSGILLGRMSAGSRADAFSRMIAAQIASQL